MERKTAHDFDQELLILFDAYVHGGLDRRSFLDKAAKYAVGGVTALMLLEQLSPKFLEAQVIKPEDARIQQQYIEYPSPSPPTRSFRWAAIQATKTRHVKSSPSLIRPRRGRISSPPPDFSRPGLSATESQARWASATAAAW